MQDTHFYLFMGDHGRVHGNVTATNWQLKRINSETGPVDNVLSDAIQSRTSVEGQTAV